MSVVRIGATDSGHRVSTMEGCRLHENLIYDSYVEIHNNIFFIFLKNKMGDSK